MRETFVDYPFVLEETTLLDEEGPYEALSWRPGVLIEVVGDPYGGTDEAAYAHALGKMVLTEISSHALPRPYPERVFYLREWIDPNGKRFGKRNLRVTTRQNFEAMKKGYRHPFEVRQAPDGTQAA